MQPDPLTSREDADHWFGDPHAADSRHPDAERPEPCDCGGPHDTSGPIAHVEGGHPDCEANFGEGGIEPHRRRSVGDVFPVGRKDK